MKKLIVFLLAAVVTAYAVLNVAPPLYARYTSEQYLRRGESQLSSDDIEKGIENLRLAIHINEGSPPVFRNKSIDEIPDILLNAAGANPLRFDEISAFAAQNGISLPCATRLGMFSSLLENTLSAFKQAATGAETAEKIKKIEENLTAASRWAAGCEIAPDDEARFTTYKRAYEKLSKKTFIEQPISTTRYTDEPPIPIRTPSAQKPVLSILDAPKNLLSSIKNLIRKPPAPSETTVTQTATPAPPPPAAPAAAQPAAVPTAATQSAVVTPAPAPPTTTPPAATKQPPAAAQPQPKPTEPQSPTWVAGIKKSLEKTGLKPEKIEIPGDRSLRLSVRTSSEGAALIDEMKAIFEVVERNVTKNGMIDKIVRLKLDILNDKGVKTAGWTITLDDYRLYRIGEISGKEFMKKLVQD